MTAPSPSLPATVGVLGGGRMGAGIAHAFLLGGADVLVVERDAAAAAAARDRVTRSTHASQERGLLEGSVEDALARLRVSVDAADLADRQLVIEAVPEDRALKVASLQRVESHLRPDAVLASNTSSLSVTDLATVLERPENFLGLHFFNPVPASDLIEVVVGERTGPELVDAARAWTEALGKTAVVVRDAPGFASSRLGVAIALEAIRMVEEGVAAPEDIDNAMVLGYRHPTGPLRTTDLVGLEVRLGIAEHLASTLGPRFEPPQLLRDKVARGELGRKSGTGFFDWS
ncbi:3-hydroxybutyryl-CoA dehydrogenase [Brachybacterium vulturis]|uniref:3-hydroxybutyryl-CoA dehydrogenase n=1 Tax=Brachybacterium vulturis TaxID=2017484 RepID=A0A291GJZ2_9MICO|nr:3-hydroxyacyl-CoA dehydrogenase family protein [Brachybacterium vulturis]ATG50517.1 3-hydroxybutyryl-CoA dehydrogenase [Brachybacterium vulturis]